MLAVKQLSHLPVVVDPSHACGKAWMVERMAMAAVAAGADGLIIEVHNDPAHALCDGAQSITPDQFAGLMPKLQAVAACVGRLCDGRQNRSDRSRSDRRVFGHGSAGI